MVKLRDWNTSPSYKMGEEEWCLSTRGYYFHDNPNDHENRIRRINQNHDWMDACKEEIHQYELKKAYGDNYVEPKK